MKKALSVVVLLAVAVPVFAAAVVWESGPPPLLVPWNKPPVESAKPKIQPQSNQETPKEMLSPSNPQPYPAANDAPRQQKDREAGQEGPPQTPWGWLVLSAIVFTWIVAQIFKVLDRRDSKRRAEEAARRTQRDECAYLLVEQGSFEGGIESNPLRITLSMTNVGKTRATIVAHTVQGFVGAHPPKSLDDDRLLQRDMEGFVMPPQQTCHHHFSVISIDPEKIQSAREGRETIYVHGRFLYRDEFREAPLKPYGVSFLLRYDIKRGRFTILTHRSST